MDPSQKRRTPSASSRSGPSSPLFPPRPRTAFERQGTDMKPVTPSSHTHAQLGLGALVALNDPPPPRRAVFVIVKRNASVGGGKDGGGNLDCA